MSKQLPPSAIDWNHFFNLAVVIALVALSVVMGAMIYFTLRNRERKGQKVYSPEKSLSRTRAREAVAFALTSIIILSVVSAVGVNLTPNARIQPTVAESYIVDVSAYRWGFTFIYPNNISSIGQCNLPSNTTVMFNVTSTDVMHNFYLVEYRVSIDAIPGRYNIIWVKTPTIVDNDNLSYSIVCKELCGYGHTYMTAPMTVMPQASFDQWLANQTNSNSTAMGG